MEVDSEELSFVNPRPPCSLNNTLVIRPRNLELDGDKFLVYLRLKPSEGNSETYIVENEHTLKTLDPKRNVSSERRFTFSSILPASTSQDKIFETCVKPLLQSFLMGADCAVMTYGTTSAGKTFTMHGANGQPGIIPRAIFTIFSALNGWIEASIYQPVASSLIKVLSEDDIVKENRLKMKLLGFSSNETTNFSTKSTCSPSFGVPSYIEMENNFSADLQFSGFSTLCKVSVWISMIEIYNEQVIDLLVHPESKNKGPSATVSEDSNGCFYAKNVRQVNVLSGHEAFQICQIGRSNLHRGATALNDRSSRSHCVLFVSLVRHAENPIEMKVNRFSFVDLAGSERSKTTQNVGARLNESNSINRSLTTLGKCIRTMKENQASRTQLPVPFRDSKLTKLFKNALCGAEKFTFIVNISMDPILYGETLNVLKFSALAQEVQRITKTKSRFSQIAASGRFQMQNFAWASSQSDLPSLRDETIDPNRLLRRVAILESTVEDQKRELNMLQSKVAESEELLEEAVEKYHKERKIANELREKCWTWYGNMKSSQNEEMKSRDTQLKSLKKECAELEKDYDHLERKYLRLKEKMRKQDDEVRPVIEENQKLRKKTEKLETMLDEAAVDYQTLSSENDVITEEKQNAESALEEQRALEEELRQEIEFLGLEVAALKKAQGVDADTNTSPLTLSHAATVTSPLITFNSGTNTTPHSFANAGTNVSPYISSNASTNVTPYILSYANSQMRPSLNLINLKPGETCENVNREVSHSISPFEMISSWKGSKSQENLCVEDIGVRATKSKRFVGSADFFSPENVSFRGRDLRSFLNQDTLCSDTKEIGGKSQEAENTSDTDGTPVSEGAVDLASTDYSDVEEQYNYNKKNNNSSENDLLNKTTEEEEPVKFIQRTDETEPAEDENEGSCQPTEETHEEGEKGTAERLVTIDHPQEDQQPPSEECEREESKKTHCNEIQVLANAPGAVESLEIELPRRKRGMRKARGNDSPENYPNRITRSTLRGRLQKNSTSKSCEDLPEKIVATPDSKYFASEENLTSCTKRETEKSVLKVKPEEGGCGKSMKKVKTAKKVRDPFDHPALSRTVRGKKNDKENVSPEEMPRKVKKKLFTATDDLLDLSDADSPFVSPVKKNLRPRIERNMKKACE